jgi:hypothetical protein
LKNQPPSQSRTSLPPPIRSHETGGGRHTCHTFALTDAPPTQPWRSPPATKMGDGEDHLPNMNPDAVSSVFNASTGEASVDSTQLPAPQQIADPPPNSLHTANPSIGTRATNIAPLSSATPTEVPGPVQGHPSLQHGEEYLKRMYEVSLSTLHPGDVERHRIGVPTMVELKSFALLCKNWGK